MRLASAASALLLSAALALGGETSFSGSWIRNPKISDDPKAKIEAAARATLERSRGRGLLPLPEEADEVDARLQRGLGSLVLAAEKLVIEDEGGELQVDDGEAPTRIFYLDGKKHVRQTPGGAKLETLCLRQGRQIVIQQKTEQGTRVSETYALSVDDGRLTLTVRLEGKRIFSGKEPLVVTTVYDRER